MRDMPVHWNRMRPITSGITHTYNSRFDLPDWCLQDLPLLVVPHPDFDTTTQAQLRMKSALSAEQGLSEEIEKIEILSNQIGLMKCADGVFRRISVRYLHGNTHQ